MDKELELKLARNFPFEALVPLEGLVELKAISKATTIFYDLQTRYAILQDGLQLWRTVERFDNEEHARNWLAATFGA